MAKHGLRLAETLHNDRDREAKRIRRRGGRSGTTPRAGVSPKVYNPYLERLGWAWTPTMSIGSGCTVHLRNDELPRGRLIVRTSRHVVVLHTKEGAALVRRTMHKRQQITKGAMPMSHDVLSSIVKQYGIVAFCKHVIDNPSHIDEHGLTKLITEDAQRRFPNLSAAAAFSKSYSEDVLLRKAVQATRDRAFAEMHTEQMHKAALLPTPTLRTQPAVTGGRAALGAGDGSSRTAYEQLEDLTREQMKRAENAGRSFAQVFEATYRMNPELARREREENRPTFETRLTG